MGSSPSPTPPIAARKDHSQVWHGRTFVDPYYWLREKGAPEVVKYLEAENAYTEAMTAGIAPFAGALYAEMLGRIKQTDLGVPTRIGRFYYYRRTVEGQQYPIRSRKPAGPGRGLPRGRRRGGAARPERDGERPRLPGDRRVRGERRRRAAAVLDRRHWLSAVPAVRQGPRDRCRAGAAGRARHERGLGQGRRDRLLRDRAPGHASARTRSGDSGSEGSPRRSTRRRTSCSRSEWGARRTGRSSCWAPARPTPGTTG